jgi:hypothetical protein
VVIVTALKKKRNPVRSAAPTNVVPRLSERGGTALQVGEGIRRESNVLYHIAVEFIFFGNRTEKGSLPLWSTY